MDWRQSTAEHLIRAGIEESAEVKKRLLERAPQLAEIASVIADAYRWGRKLIAFGNGGSAADAQHIVAELVGRFLVDRRALPALALTCNSSTLTAIGNDYAYDEIFARQIDAFGQPGDVALGISTSGNSSNVVNAIERAHKNGLVTIGLTGAGGGTLAEIADYCVCIPTQSTPRVQECHILVGHLWCEWIEADMIKQDKAAA
ncbi:Phosphoheptose isomerase [Planctomycetes bacterium Pan216]|uniref:Phosphoheptose isomerase n=1 Tax=Kolteria novifilia TaxID=2527975 RepID=A0A518AYN4_9BACT|nr:Phosphoheptose isomerase [Planctomycetes bacterium Pan216]